MASVKVFIYEKAADKILKKLCRPPTSKPKFPIMETQLHDRYKARRTRGRKVSPLWLVVTAKEIIAKEYPTAKFMASRGWRQRFQFRHDIVLRKKTNSKSESIESRLPKMQHWHRQLRRFLQERRANTDAQPTDQYGRFPLHLRFNVDQVGVPGVIDQTTTLDDRGTTRVWINTPGSGSLEKRQATLQLCFHPDPDAPQPRPAVIFRGQGVRVSPVEKAAIDKRVDVYWQAKAWLDRVVACAWAEGTLAPAIAAVIAAKGGKLALLFADNLDGQTCEQFKNAAAKAQAFVYNLVAGCTDEIQPVDAGYGREIKRAYGAAMAKWLQNDANLDKWEEGMTASERRILMTKWVRLRCVIARVPCFIVVWQIGDAVEHVNKNRKAIARYFEKTGCSMTADGSGDEKIQPEHTRSYSFAGDPMLVGDDAKDEKKGEMKEEGDESGNESDADSEVEDAESDDEADPETRVKSIQEAVPPGWKLSAVAPAINDTLVGTSVVFKWNVIGWANGVVSKMRTGRKGRKYNFEITYPPDVVYPHKLSQAQHTSNNAAPAGAWCVIVPA
jgi:hypothetical protein